jgi:hypothetical protein
VLTPATLGSSDQDVSVREAEHLWGGEPGEDEDMIGERSPRGLPKRMPSTNELDLRTSLRKSAGFRR